MVAPTRGAISQSTLPTKNHNRTTEGIANHLHPTTIAIPTVNHSPMVLRITTITLMAALPTIDGRTTPTKSPLTPVTGTNGEHDDACK